jgi:hypothetical protein
MASATYANLDPSATSFAAANTTALVAAKRHHRHFTAMTKLGGKDNLNMSFQPRRAITLHMFALFAYT